jgi:CHRD domain
MRRGIIGTAIVALAAAGIATAMISTAGGAGGRSAALSDKALFATLTGANEVGGGDRDGKGAANVLVTSSKVCFGISVAGLDRPIAAHIHRGRARQNGAIVIPLKAPNAGNPGTSAGCVTAAANLRNSLKTGASGFYVNVHTRAFGDGAVRGQLHP